MSGDNFLLISVPAGEEFDEHLEALRRRLHGTYKNIGHFDLPEFRFGGYDTLVSLSDGG